MDLLFFLCKNDLFGVWPRKILVYRTKYFSDPPHIFNGTLEFFCQYWPLFGSFWGLHFGRRGGGCAFICLCIRTRVEKAAQEGWNHPLWRSKKMVISSQQLKLLCLTPSQRANLKVALNTPAVQYLSKRVLLATSAILVERPDVRGDLEKIWRAPQN